MGAIITSLFGLLRDITTAAARRAKPPVSRLAERLRPLTAWLAERFRPLTALLGDVAVIAGTYLRRAYDKFLAPAVAKLTERFGVRTTVVGAVTALFIGSTGSAAWAITNIDDPAQEPRSSTVAAETAPSEDPKNPEGTTEAQQEAAAAEAAEAEAEQKAAEEAAAEEEAKKAEPEPVGGLSDLQMDNAIAIVEAGDEQGLDRKAWAIALATAMQESKFRNYANVNVPESYDHEFQAEGSDHDSVGLFQQRPSSGWGSVGELMEPKTSAKKFYGSLEKVDGWQDMPVTHAAQTVQVSAFPDAYAQWEDLAWEIVEEYESTK